MPQKIINVPSVGDVLIVKRRKSKSIRLSIAPSGRIRVSQPYWAPYVTGVSFVKRKSAWIKSQIELQQPILLEDKMRIGKLHRLYLTNSPNTRNVKISDTEIIVPYRTGASKAMIQEKALIACEKSLKIEAKNILPQRLETLANEHSLPYADVNVRKLTARWGSCSSQGVITLNYYLVQLPWYLIDYVLIHELTHTKHLHHGNDFWQAFLKIEPNARKYQKEIRQHKPRVEPF